MSTETIYKRLIQAGLTPAGACGLMGNMYAESSMKANIAQRGMTSLSDAEYTAAADSGTINFAYDAVGYGLCQWTYYSRKLALLDFARNRGTSVGDEEMQVDFCLHELKTSYSGLWALLCSVNDVYTAASEVCTVYERPAVNNIGVRASFGNEFYSQFAGLDVGAIQPEPEKESYWPPRMICAGMSGADVAVLRALLIARDYELEYGTEFDAKLKNRVLEFQCTQGLDADGIVGKQTWAALLGGD